MTPEEKSAMMGHTLDRAKKEYDLALIVYEGKRLAYEIALDAYEQASELVWAKASD